MARAKAPGFDVDVSEASQLAGFMHGISTQMKTERHTAPVMNFVFDRMRTEFDTWVDLLARGFGMPDEEEEYLPAGNPLHHVYEWNMIGVPQARLWQTVMRGHGSEREISFNWRASKTIRPIPVVEPGPKGQQLREVHIFVWKAPIMEYNVPVTIQPKTAEHLAFPDPTLPRGLFFTSAGVTLRNPGGTETTGMFTRTFAEWWGGFGAEGMFDDTLRETLEDDFDERHMSQYLPKSSRRRTKTFAFKTLTPEAAWAEGEKVALRFMEDRTKKYYRQSEQRFHRLSDAVEEYDV